MHYVWKPIPPLSPTTIPSEFDKDLWDTDIYTLMVYIGNSKYIREHEFESRYSISTMYHLDGFLSVISSIDLNVSSVKVSIELKSRSTWDLLLYEIAVCGGTAQWGKSDSRDWILKAEPIYIQKNSDVQTANWESLALTAWKQTERNFFSM